MAEFRVGPWVCESKAQAKAAAQEILHDNHNRELSGEARAFVLALLDLHPHRGAKVGVGVETVRVLPNPEFPTTWCFWLTRTDGTETDFSYLECLRGSTHRQKVLAALREAVAADVQAFKRGFFVTHDAKVCPLSGVDLHPGNAHADHVTPFISVADAWVAAQGGYDAVAVRGSGDNESASRLASAAVESRWREYHRENAKLRVVADKANLERKRK